MKRLSLLTFCLFFSTFAFGDPFTFHFHPGDQFRYLGSGRQTVTLDGRIVQTNLQGYRIAYTVQDSPDPAQGHLKGHITFLSQREGKAASVTEEFDTDYWINQSGVFDIPDSQVMPVVRSIPTFPDRTLKVGDTWSAPAEEVHDLRATFGVDRVLRVPVQVYYTYLGPRDVQGKSLQVIRAAYALDVPTGFRFPKLDWYPVHMGGQSVQLHYFNAVEGREEGYDESYELVLTMNTGQIARFGGESSSHLEEAKIMDRDAMAESLKQDLADRGLSDVQVKPAPLGVTLTLDTIQFPGDSALLVPSEREKVRLIGEILKKYPDRHILVEGHTAVSSSTVDPQVLSEDRAAAVGQALVDLGVRSPDEIVYRGWGPTKPVASNDTIEGRAKNRRVEITLLEN